MIRLPATLAAWGTPGFEAAFRKETAAIDPALLPLQQALARSSVALPEEGVEFVLLGARERKGVLEIHTALFFHGLVAGCSCADDPTPVEPVPEHCELKLEVRRPDGATEIHLL